MSLTPDAPVATPRRRSRRLLLAGLLVAVLLAGAGTAAGLLLFRKPAPIDPRALALAELSASATPTETPFAGDLRSLLLAPPADSQPFAKPFSADGTLTLAQVADWFGTTTAELTQYTDITGGAIRQFAISDMSVNIVLLNFPRPQTAHQWAAEHRDANYIGNRFTDDSPIPGYPESGLFYSIQADKYGDFDVYAYAAKNDIVMNVAIYAAPPVNHQTVTTVLEQQLARLP